MASSAFVWNFFVSTFLTSDSKKTSHLTRGANNAGYVVSIENCTILSYDVVVSNNVVSGSNLVAFLVAGNEQDNWNAEALQILPFKNAVEICPLTCKGSSQGSARIHATAMTTRLSSNHGWVSWSTGLPIGFDFSTK